MKKILLLLTILVGTLTAQAGENSGNIYIEGGTLFVNAATEGIESKGELRITGGEVTVNAKDDAINAAGRQQRAAEEALRYWRHHHRHRRTGERCQSYAVVLSSLVVEQEHLVCDDRWQ